MTIQYHWLKIEDVPTIFPEIDSVGVDPAGAVGDIPRNVGGWPVAGPEPGEMTDATGRRSWASLLSASDAAFGHLS